MSRLTLLVVTLLCTAQLAISQSTCASTQYFLEELKKDPSLASKQDLPSAKQNTATIEVFGNSTGSSVIKIPVVVHVLYNNVSQNISNEQVQSQIDVLNKEFRLKHEDTSKIPTYFRPFAADTEFEFVLASVTPQGNATNGIVRKSTATQSFGMDDKIKYSSKGGDDAWDSDQYLNIWVGNLVSGVMGYSSVLGGTKEKDGVVLTYTAFGTVGAVVKPYHKGRTAVHEIGHWMGLKHIWGDSYCGNDGVDDTPQQSSATRGCPVGILTSACSVSPTGIMYNNYMDLTSDECTNMFTLGQKARMRSSFATGGAHAKLAGSSALSATPLPALPVREEVLPQVSKVVPGVYPNPSVSYLMVDLKTLTSLVGETAIIYNQLGQQMMQYQLTQTVTRIDISRLKDGAYFLKIGKSGGTVKVSKSSYGSMN